MMFAEEDDDDVDFFDFTEAVHAPDCLIKFQNMRMLQNVCLLPNLHLLIEGGLLAEEVEVYQLSKDVGSLNEPIHVIQTGARGLSAIDFSEEKICMGFQGSMVDVRGVVLIYNFEYELQTRIFVGVMTGWHWMRV